MHSSETMHYKMLKISNAQTITADFRLVVISVILIPYILLSQLPLTQSICDEGKTLTLRVQISIYVLGFSMLPILEIYSDNTLEFSPHSATGELIHHTCRHLINELLISCTWTWCYVLNLRIHLHLPVSYHIRCHRLTGTPIMDKINGEILL